MHETIRMTRESALFASVEISLILQIYVGAIEKLVPPMSTTDALN